MRLFRRRITILPLVALSLAVSGSCYGSILSFGAVANDSSGTALRELLSLCTDTMSATPVPKSPQGDRPVDCEENRLPDDASGTSSCVVFMNGGSSIPGMAESSLSYSHCCVAAGWVALVSSGRIPFPPIEDPLKVPIP